jgi:HK97 family phage prohead protease
MAILKVSRQSEPNDRRWMVGGKRAQVPRSLTPSVTPPKDSFGVCEHDGKRFYARKSGEQLFLCLPDPSGILWQTEERILPVKSMAFHELTNTNFPAVKSGKFGSFQSRPEFEVDQKMVSVKEGDRIVDYLNVAIEGAASTYNEDRDRERILPGSFDATLMEFKRNPVMLIDHNNSVHNIAGSFSKLRASDSALEVRGEVSNAPELRKVRFLIAEKHLKAFSIGGMFRYSERNYQEIEEVKLFEISLVAVPANPEAIFTSRSVSVEDAKKAFDRFSRLTN